MKFHKSIYMAIVFLIIFGIGIAGCGQQGKKGLITGDEPVKESSAPDTHQEDNLASKTKVEPDINVDSTGTSSNIELRQEPAQVQFTFYPSGMDFTKSIIDKRGKIEISNELRERFNLFARDYRFVYLPEMNYYESFFDADQYAKSFGYNNFGFAVFYVLQYMRNPERMSADAMQNAIQSLFVAKDSYKDVPNQAFRKLANYQDGYYSPSPEGGLDHNRLFYLLTELSVSQEGTNAVLIKMHYRSYYFNDPTYQPGENEKWLAEKSKNLGIPDLQAAEKLVESGDIEELKDHREFETTVYIKLDGENQYGFNPRFVSSQEIKS